MPRSYSDHLAEWVKRREESARRDRNLVAFLAVKDDVKQAVDAGYAVKTIWAHMCEGKRVTFGYDTFLKYVKRHIRQPHDDATGVVAAPSRQSMAPKHRSNPDRAAPRAGGQDPLAGFTFNAAPNKEELI